MNPSPSSVVTTSPVSAVIHVPSVALGVVTESAQSHVLVVVLHHIVADGASIVRLVAELAACYAGAQDGLPPLPVQYADYAAWQRNWMEAGEAQRQLGYWRERLGDSAGAALDLPADRPRRAARSGEGAEHVFTIPAAAAAALRTLAATRHATLNMALLAAWAVLLGRHTGQSDLRIYQARLDDPDAPGKIRESSAQRHFCGHCGSALWLFDPRWPELLHPHASAIDTPLPQPPAHVHLMLGSKANWVEVEGQPGDERFDAYPSMSLDEWHERRGLASPRGKKD